MGTPEVTKVEVETLGRLVKEIITQIAGVKNASVYVDTLEPHPYVIIEVDYQSLPEELREFLFSFEFRFNKILSVLLGDSAPYVEVQITPKLFKGKNHLKIE